MYPNSTIFPFCFGVCLSKLNIRNKHTRSRKRLLGNVVKHGSDAKVRGSTAQASWNRRGSFGGETQPSRDYNRLLCLYPIFTESLNMKQLIASCLNKSAYDLQGGIAAAAAVAASENVRSLTGKLKIQVVLTEPSSYWFVEGLRGAKGA